METFEVQGLWWIPKKKGSMSATGALKYSLMHRGELSVFGRDLDNGRFVEPVLYGDTADGPVTLYDVILSDSRWISTSTRYAQVLSCETVIRGGHFPRGCRFKGAEIHVKHLDEWARLGRFVPLGADLRKNVPDARTGSVFKQGSSVSSVLPDGSNVTLGVGFGEKNATMTTTLTARHYFSISFSAAKTLDQIIEDYARPLWNLLTLATDEPSSLLELKVFGRSGKGPGPISFPVSTNVGIALSESSRQTSPGTQIIRFEDFSFPDQLPAWFKLDQELRGIHGLVYGLRNAENMTVENRFLNAVTAAEALHRATFTNARAKISFKNTQTNVWLDQYPKDERALIKSRLSQYINDPSLGDRLSGLADKAGEAFDVLVADETRWKKIVKDTRNALTHQEGLPKVTVTSGQMYWLAESVAILVQMCFMADLKISSSEIKKMYARSRYSQLVGERLYEFV